MKCTQKSPTVYNKKKCFAVAVSWTNSSVKFKTVWRHQTLTVLHSAVCFTLNQHHHTSDIKNMLETQQWPSFQQWWHSAHWHFTMLFKITQLDVPAMFPSFSIRTSDLVSETTPSVQLCKLTLEVFCFMLLYSVQQINTSQSQQHQLHKHYPWPPSKHNAFCLQTGEAMH